ncbi:hypothetical protein ACHAXR_008707 [Thalassiosira sp. AJA248-18]
MTIYDSLSSSYRKLVPTHQSNSNLSLSSLEIATNKSNNKATTTAPTPPRRGTAWYVCGPTVYDSAHLGHGRTYVSLDIMRRVALHLHNYHAGTTTPLPPPIYVMNITDVDDKIIQRSIENYTTANILKKTNNPEEKEVEASETVVADPIALARQYEVEFWQDMDALNVLRPDVICRVSEHVEETIVPYIQEIVEGGMAYVLPECGDEANNDESNNNDDDDMVQQQQEQQQPPPTPQGSVYFDVRAFESITNGRTKYGKLAPDVASTDFFTWEESNNNSDEEANNTIGEDEGEPKLLRRRKRDPRDFCLWKYRPRTLTGRTGGASTYNRIIEPSSVSYPSPWGPGRPGWHVECSAMIQRLSLDFASTHEFGVHAGGVDLKFPHHSNEIAQAEAYSMATSSRSGLNNDNNNNKKSTRDDNDDFREWISHWIHTGHLYVKGRKMSKSLKNFVTIREMLAGNGSNNNNEADSGIESCTLDQNNNPWSSPADDFRLWVLGLSGAYRGPATYSQDRMDEARVIREKWVRFLMEGQECLARLNQKSISEFQTNNDGGGGTTTSANKKFSSSSSSRLWGEEDLELFHTVTQCSMNCREALVDDLDGASFVKELNHIVDIGMEYIQQVVAKADDGQGNNKNQPSKSRPEEPLRFVLDTFRGQLDLVGFTQRTVNAGVSTQDTSSSSSSLGQHQQLGVASSSNNTAVLDKAVAFRSAVRSAALNALRKKEKGGSSPLDAAKEILGLCDEMRDDAFPKLGVEILDGKVVVEKDVVEGVNGSSANDRGWRYCSPRESKASK